MHLRCRSTRLQLMGALSLTPRKPRGRSGLHSTPGLTRLLPRRCTPSFHRDHLWIIQSPLWGSIPRGTRFMINRMTGEPILPARTANQILVRGQRTRYWFAVRAGKIGSPVMRFITTYACTENISFHTRNVLLLFPCYYYTCDLCYLVRVEPNDSYRVACIRDDLLRLLVSS
jgi:hypothetical protein